MSQSLYVGIIGDYDANRLSHIATNGAIGHAARALSVTVERTWLPTLSLDEPGSEATLTSFDALWCAPGSPYKSMDGALGAIRFAREHDWPFIGT
jgi:CTP synthase (UTP-ammonia lyase)